MRASRSTRRRVSRKAGGAVYRSSPAYMGMKPADSSIVAPRGIPRRFMPIGAFVLQPFPRVAHVYLTTTTNLLANTANPGLYNKLLYANSCYDPFNTGAGATQPQYYDQVKAIYPGYKVLSSSLTVHAVSSGNPVTEVVVFPTNDSSNDTSVAKARAQPTSKSLVLYNSGNAVAGSIVLQATTAQIIGPDVYSGGTGANVANNPSTLWYWHIVVGPTVAADINTTLALRIVQEVVFCEQALDEDA